MAIVEWVEDQGFLSGHGELVVHPWQVLDFSSVYSIERVGPDARSGVFVKVPKADVEHRTVLPTGERDREMAEEEFRSLRYVEKHWPTEGEVRYVQPLGFCRRHSAIVTRRSYGRDMFWTWRHHDLRRRIGLGGSDSVRGWFANLGRGLRGYHDASSREQGRTIESELGDPVAKIARSISRLRSFGAVVAGVATLADDLRQFEGRRIESPRAMTLKGLDLRNILLEEDGCLMLLDPGRLTPDDPVADLARLTATCRILYWGGMWLFLGLQPAREYETHLRGGYGTISPESLQLYDLYLLKELFKQWVAAYVTIDRKTWPTSVKKMLARTYVDQFYRRELRAELSRVIE